MVTLALEGSSQKPGAERFCSRTFTLDSAESRSKVPPQVGEGLSQGLQLCDDCRVHWRLVYHSAGGKDSGTVVLVLMRVPVGPNGPNNRQN